MRFQAVFLPFLQIFIEVLNSVKTEPKVEPIEETEIVADIETRKTPKKVPIMPKVNVETDVKTLEVIFTSYFYIPSQFQFLELSV